MIIFIFDTTVYDKNMKSFIILIFLVSSLRITSFAMYFYRLTLVISRNKEFMWSYKDPKIIKNALKTKQITS